MDPKYEQLNKLNEADFRSSVLMPLLKRMKYEQVRLRHGSQEYGKDITCYQTGVLGSINYAIVAKAGDISGAASGRNSILVGTIRDQIRQAFTVPIEDVTYPQSETYVNHVIVWTNGKISGNAQKRILHDIQMEYRNNVTFIDGQKTVEYLELYYPEFFTIGDASISNYYKNAKTMHSRLEELYALGGPNAPKHLPTIFVAPTLRHIPRVRSKQAMQEGLPNKRYSFSKLLKLRVNTFIFGDMGSGKSTLLRRMLISIIEDNE
ncbi:MAG: restriction endonuclease, partial [Chloroflexi bacterium]|nr:restriction endonuclease [Chloroflexota bacterium]